MKTSIEQIRRRFLHCTAEDAWQSYRRALAGEEPCWDYVILTASNAMQAQAFRSQIDDRLARRQLPAATAYAVLPDPDGKRVGSGGATFNVLRYLAASQPGRDPFAGKRILVIHSGGDSKRIPQYSAVGKLFSPVPRALPNGRPATLFDEFMVGMAGVAGRVRAGMLVLSGDVLLQFSPLQLDLDQCDAAAISMKEDVEIGKDHGVFLDRAGWVGRFLHKQTPEQLRRLGAVNAQNCVDLDTGAIWLGVPVLRALFSLISANGAGDDRKFARFVNERARISFYGDFLYPLAVDSTLEEYYTQAPEGQDTPELRDCRTNLWNVLSPYRLRLVRLAPAAFVHFGTTVELLALVHGAEGRYECLNWKRQVASALAAGCGCAANNALADADCRIGAGSYLENCALHGVQTGEGCIVAGVELQNVSIPAHTVVHGLPLQDGGSVVRVYGVQDNPKALLEDGAVFLGRPLRNFLQNNGLTEADLWPNGGVRDLWNAQLYPVCEQDGEAASAAETVWKMAEGRAGNTEKERWRAALRMSLAESFNEADVAAVIAWDHRLQDRIRIQRLCERLRAGSSCANACRALGPDGLTAGLYAGLMNLAEGAELGLKMRIYYALSRMMKEQQAVFDGQSGQQLEDRCFEALGRAIYRDAAARLTPLEGGGAGSAVTVSLPVRVNWGGGWTDTPPQCMELGGVVLNAALLLNGEYPVTASIRPLSRPVIELESIDSGDRARFERLDRLQNCRDVNDPFALHKAALIASGVIPLNGGGDLQELLRKLGGGFVLSTQVKGVPRGSGLGTSSILAGACVLAVFRYLGKSLPDDRLYDMVSCAEQLMSTGGGWQDQVGGVTPGIKFITTKPGLHQEIRVEQISVPAPARAELQERFALIYTGQRRLARNLLREVVGRYIGGQPAALEALESMKQTARRMREALCAGDVDRFAQLLDLHWKLSQQLDEDCTNTGIDHIFLAVEDLIDGRFIAGAGGGGFLQVILKKGVDRAQLAARLHEVFQDSGVQVWDSRFIYE